MYVVFSEQQHIMRNDLLKLELNFRKKKIGD
jgi:hypothetical protein